MSINISKSPAISLIQVLWLNVKKTHTKEQRFVDKIIYLTKWLLMKCVTLSVVWSVLIKGVVLAEFRSMFPKLNKAEAISGRIDAFGWELLLEGAAVHNCDRLFIPSPFLPFVDLIPIPRPQKNTPNKHLW